MTKSEILFNQQFVMTCCSCGHQPCEIELKSDIEGAELFVSCPNCYVATEIHELELTAG